MAEVDADAVAQKNADNESGFPQPAKVILPYLEERIKALEEEQQKMLQKQQQSSIESNESKQQQEKKVSKDVMNVERGLVREETLTPQDVRKDDNAERGSKLQIESSQSKSKDISTPKAPIPKNFVDIKESIKQPDSESGVTTADAGAKEENKIRRQDTSNGKELQPTLKQKESGLDAEETKSTSTSKAPVQEEMSKILTNIKESIKRPDSESDGATTDGDDAVAKADDTIKKEGASIGKEMKSEQQQKESSVNDIETESSTVQEGISKMITDIKESIRLPNSESDVPTSNVEGTDAKEIASNEREMQSKGQEQQNESRLDDEEVKSTSEIVQEQASKLFTNIKEAIKQPESESDAATTTAVDAGTKDDDEETKSATVVVQEQASKIIVNIKESMKQTASESDTIVTDSADAGANEDTTIEKGTDTSQQMEVLGKIKKVAEDMNVVRQDASNEFETKMSDLAWAGRQVMGDRVVDSSGKVIDSDDSISGLTYSALSIFGEDGIALLYQYAIDAMKTVSDALSLDGIWAELTELSSKTNLVNDPRISELLKKYNYDEEESIKRVAAASLVAIVGVTAAVAFRSGIVSDERQQSNYISSEYDDASYNTDNGIVNTLDSMYNVSPDMIPFDSGTDNWFEDGEPSSSGETYENGNGYDWNTVSPFPFATSSWDDPSSAYVDNETSLSQPQEPLSTWMDTSTDFQPSPDDITSTWTDLSQPDVNGESNMIDYSVDENSYLGSYDTPTEPFVDSAALASDVPKTTDSPFDSSSTLPRDGQKNGGDASSRNANFPPFSTSTSQSSAQNENNDSVIALKASFSPFSTSSNLSKTERDNKEATVPKTNLSPFGGSSTMPTNSQESKDKLKNPKASLSPFGASSNLPKTEQEKNNEASAPKTNFSPFGGSSTLPVKGQESEDEEKPPKASFSPFGTSSNLPKTEQENYGEGSVPKTNFSPFGGSSTMPTNSQESKDEVKPPKASFSPFGASSTLPVKGQANEDKMTPLKASFSPFGVSSNLPTTEQESNDEGSVPKTNFSPFGGSSTLPMKGQESKDEAKTPKASFSPFGASSNLPTNTQESKDEAKTPKASFSPFGASSTLPTKGQENKNEVLTPKASFSPFGASSTLPKNGPDLNASKTGLSPFTSSFTPQNPVDVDSDVASMDTATPNLSPFGVPPDMQEEEYSDENGSGVEYDLNSETTDVLSGSGSKSSDFRIKPKLASKPQNDMYERMQMEQAMRLEQFERNQTSANKSSGRKDEATLGTDAEFNVDSASGRSEERQNFVEEKVKIQEERRVIAQQRARLDEEKKMWEKQSEEEKKSEGEQIQFGGAERGNGEVEIVDLSEEDQKEKERMKEIQKLAREQARFEIEARGLPKEEKTLQEKERMERLHQLAREQAQYEYDRRRADDKRNDQSNRIRSTDTTSSEANVQNRKYDASSNQKEAKTFDRGQTTSFQTAATPSNEENMQNRVRQQRPGVPMGQKLPRRSSEKIQERSDTFQVAGSPSNEEKMQDRVGQVGESSKEKDVLMGTKKKVQDRGGFGNSSSPSKEERKRGEKARLKQLENLAKNQARYKSDPTVSTVRRSSQDMKSNDFLNEEPEGQIIDVEVADDDISEILKNKNNVNRGDQLEGRQRGDLEEMSQILSPQQNLKEKSIREESDEQTHAKDEKRKQLEAQARQRSKQQSRRTERVQPDQRDSRKTLKNITPEPATSAAVVEESEKQLPLAPGRTKQQSEVVNAILKSDGSYQPSAKALADTSRMLKEVCGISLSDYKGSKEFLTKKSNVSVYVGRPLSIPVRVTTPGSLVEFSIVKKASEFDLSILAVPDKGYAIDIKVRNR
jgi:hypothetical protein